MINDLKKNALDFDAFSIKCILSTYKMVSLWWVDLPRIVSNCTSSLSFWLCLTPLLWWYHHRIRADAQSSIDQNSWRDMVVFHPNHHFILHCQSGCLLDSRENGIPHRFSRWSGKANQDRIWGGQRWINNDLLQGKKLTKCSQWLSDTWGRG